MQSLPYKYILCMVALFIFWSLTTDVPSGVLSSHIDNTLSSNIQTPDWGLLSSFEPAFNNGLFRPLAFFGAIPTILFSILRLIIPGDVIGISDDLFIIAIIYALDFLFMWKLLLLVFPSIERNHRALICSFYLLNPHPFNVLIWGSVNALMAYHLIPAYLYLSVSRITRSKKRVSNLIFEICCSMFIACMFTYGLCVIAFQLILCFLKDVLQKGGFKKRILTFADLSHVLVAFCVVSISCIVLFPNETISHMQDGFRISHSRSALSALSFNDYFGGRLLFFDSHFEELVAGAAVLTIFAIFIYTTISNAAFGSRQLIAGILFCCLIMYLTGKAYPITLKINEWFAKLLFLKVFFRSSQNLYPIVLLIFAVVILPKLNRNKLALACLIGLVSLYGTQISSHPWFGASTISKNLQAYPAFNDANPNTLELMEALKGCKGGLIVTSFGDRSLNIKSQSQSQSFGIIVDFARLERCSFFSQQLPAPQSDEHISLLKFMAAEDVAFSKYPFENDIEYLLFYKTMFGSIMQQRFMQNLLRLSPEHWKEVVNNDDYVLKVNTRFEKPLPYISKLVFPRVLEVAEGQGQNYERFYFFEVRDSGGKINLINVPDVYIVLVTSLLTILLTATHIYRIGTVRQ